MKFWKKISILAALLVCVLGIVELTGNSIVQNANAERYNANLLYDADITYQDYDTGEVRFKVYTNVDVHSLYLYEYTDYGQYLVKKWTDYANESKVVSGSKFNTGKVREWNVKCTFSIGKCHRTGLEVYNNADFCYRNLTVFGWLYDDGYPNNAFSQVFDNNGYIPDDCIAVDYTTGKVSFEFLWVGTGYADEVRLYDDSGELLKKWTPETADRYGTTSDGCDVWWFSYTFKDKSRRTVTVVLYDKEAGKYAMGPAAKCVIFKNNQPAVREYDITSATFANGYAAKGTAAKATVKTEKDAKYLNMYSEDGTLITTWKAADCSTLSGDTRVWNVSYKFGSTGAREMTFKASYNNTDLSAGVTAKVLITSGNSINVNSAKFASDSAAKGTAAKITVKTGADAKYLAMFNGSTKIKTWNAADCSKIEGTLRVWNVSYAFSGTGTKNMTFKASKDNATYGTEKTANILITSGSSINVFSAKFSADYAPKGTDVTIIVKTGADAKYLAMYNGSSKLKTWKAADYSKISGTTRVWTVSYTFTGTGTKNMTFKGSKDNKTFGTAKNDSILITSGNSINVTSAKFGVDYAPKGTAVTITVKTGADAKYLVMYNGSTKIKTWKAADYSKISGTNRVWTVKYTFTGTGTKDMTFKASKDNATFGTAKNDSVLITSGSSINVNSAKFAESSVVKGTSVSITVKTGADAKYLAMFSESGGKAKTWKAADYSRISGTVRVWTVTYTFSGAGNRSMTFKASKDNSTFGTGKTANIKITAN